MVRNSLFKCFNHCNCSSISLLIRSCVNYFNGDFSFGKKELPLNNIYHGLCPAVTVHGYRHLRANCQILVRKKLKFYERKEFDLKTKSIFHCVRFLTLPNSLFADEGATASCAEFCCYNFVFK